MKWHAEPPRSGDGSWRIVDDFGDVIGYVETGRLDAARVAAAPVMLAEIKGVTQFLAETADMLQSEDDPHIDRWVEQLRALIDQAEGTT